MDYSLDACQSPKMLPPKRQLLKTQWIKAFFPAVFQIRMLKIKLPKIKLVERCQLLSTSTHISNKKQMKMKRTNTQIETKADAIQSDENFSSMTTKCGEPWHPVNFLHNNFKQRCSYAAHCVYIVVQTNKCINRGDIKFIYYSPVQYNSKVAAVYSSIFILCYSIRLHCISKRKYCAFFTHYYLAATTTVYDVVEISFISTLKKTLIIVRRNNSIINWLIIM